MNFQCKGEQIQAPSHIQTREELVGSEMFTQRRAWLNLNATEESLTRKTDTKPKLLLPFQLAS